MFIHYFVQRQQLTSGVPSLKDTFNIATPNDSKTIPFNYRQIFISVILLKLITQLKT